MTREITATCDHCTAEKKEGPFEDYEDIVEFDEMLYRSGWIRTRSAPEGIHEDEDEYTEHEFCSVTCLLDHFEDKEDVAAA